MINDPIAHQTAGTAYDVHIAAYGTTPTDAECGIIETYTGAKTLKLWFDYEDPTSGTRQVLINGSAAATSEGASVNQAVTFANGQAQVSARHRAPRSRSE